MSSPCSETNIGIDVSKETLDVAVHENNTHWTTQQNSPSFPN